MLSVAQQSGPPVGKIDDGNTHHAIKPHRDFIDPQLKLFTEQIATAIGRCRLVFPESADPDRRSDDKEGGCREAPHSAAVLG